MSAPLPPDLALHRLAAGTPAGPLVLLVHGMEDRWESWRGMVGCLDASWRVLAVDAPWRVGNTYRWRRHATPGRWLAHALERAGEPVDLLVGHSFGANAVLELLADRATAPDQATGHHTPGRAAALLSPFFRAPDVPVSWKLFDRSRHNFDVMLRQGLELRLGERAAEMDPDVLAAMLSKRWSDRIGPLGFMALFEQFVTSGDLPLESVSVPCLVLGSTTDPSLSHGRGQALASALPDATLCLKEEFVHFCHIGQAAEVAQRLTDFFKEACCG